MKTKLLIAIALTSPTLALADGSPWLPIPGSSQVTFGIINSSGDRYDEGGIKKTLPAKIKQNTYSLGAKYGVLDQLAIDARVNYVDSKFDMDKQGKLGDSTIGVSWRAVDEFENMMAPTVTLRANAIIKGKYETGRPDAIGDGGSGGELSVLVGKYLMPKLTAAGELGYRKRNNSIPSDIWVDLNAGYSVTSMVGLSAGFTVSRSQGDLDIGGPGFTGPRFPETKENRNIVKLGVSVAPMSNVSFNVNYGKVVSGRNTTLATLWGASVTAAF